MEIIYAISAGSVIRVGFGKLYAVGFEQIRILEEVR
jgi:hypothetical protein